MPWIMRKQNNWKLIDRYTDILDRYERRSTKLTKLNTDLNIVPTDSALIDQMSH